jgi:hypothetical protein
MIIKNYDTILTMEYMLVLDNHRLINFELQITYLFNAISKMRTIFLQCLNLFMDINNHKRIGWIQMRDIDHTAIQ